MFCALFAALSRAAAGPAAAAIPAAAAAPSAAAAAPAEASAAPSAASAAPSAASAAPSENVTAPDDGRDVLCSGNESAEKVYIFLISTRQRANDIEMVTTEQGSSKHRPDAAADDAIEHLEDTPPPSTDKADSAPATKKRRTKAKKSTDDEDAMETDDTRKDSPARNYRRPDDDNPFVKRFPNNSGTGMKLGSAVTVATMLIQGPYPKEDRRDNKDHRRFVMSGMLNVCSAATMRTFEEMAEKDENAMYAYCLLRVESARVTLQRAVTQLQKFINTHFGGPAGIAPNWIRMHHAYTFVLKLSTEIVICGSFLRSPTRPINP